MLDRPELREHETDNVGEFRTVEKEPEMTDRREYPEYQCHKRVRAAKIVHITIREMVNDRAEFYDLNLEAPFSPVTVDRHWMEAKNAQDGGYLVVYDDGYTSFSPESAFEAGYTRIL